MERHFTQLAFDPEILSILSCVNIDSSLDVILILAPLSSAIVRIVVPPRPVTLHHVTYVVIRKLSCVVIQNVYRGVIREDRLIKEHGVAGNHNAVKRMGSIKER